MRVNLSDVWLRALRPPATGRIEVRDDKSPGLVARLTPNGVLSFAVRARRPDGREARITLGQWPQTTLAEARKRALSARAALVDGKDPVAERRALRHAVAARAAMPTVAEQLAEWQAAHARRWSDRYAREIARLCARELAPILDRPLAETNRQDWVALLAAVARRTPGCGFYLYRAVSSFLSYAEAHGWIDAHPLPRRGAGRIAPAVPARDRVLDDVELRRVWHASAALRPQPRAFVRLLVTTGCRVGEAAGIAVGEVDFTAAAWRLPAGRTKNKRPHIVPIPPALLAELAALVPQGDRQRLAGYRVLGYVRGNALAGVSDIKRALDAKSEVQNWRLHDLRRGVRSGLAALGVPPDIAERCLNHAGATALEAVYNRHNYEAEILAALRRWQNHLAALVG